MKTTILSAVASLTLALGAAAQQGNFVLDNTILTNVLAVDAPGSSHQGTFGMEVWVLKGTNIPEGINLTPAPGAPVLVHDLIKAAGFVKEATYTNRQTTAPGSDADLLTHCIAGCELARHPGICGGPDDALDALQRRETQNTLAAQIDRLNNEAGIGIGVSPRYQGQSCKDACLDALNRGVLSTINNGVIVPHR
jgi:hypothetical protein